MGIRIQNDAIFVVCEYIEAWNLPGKYYANSKKKNNGKMLSVVKMRCAKVV